MCVGWDPTQLSISPCYSKDFFFFVTLKTDFKGQILQYGYLNGKPVLNK